MRRDPDPTVIIPHEVALVAGLEISIWVILGKYPL